VDSYIYLLLKHHNRGCLINPVERVKFIFFRFNTVYYIVKGGPQLLNVKPVDTEQGSIQLEPQQRVNLAVEIHGVDPLAILDTSRDDSAIYDKDEIIKSIPYTGVIDNY